MSWASGYTSGFSLFVPDGDFSAAPVCPFAMTQFSGLRAQFCASGAQLPTFSSHSCIRSALHTVLLCVCRPLPSVPSLAAPSRWRLRR